VKFATTYCVDIKRKRHFLESVLRSCGKLNIGSLYTGFAEVLTDNTGIQHQVIYTLNSQDTVFALMKKREEVVCDTSLY